MGNVGLQSFGHGMASMFGIGSLAWSDPVSDAQNEVADTKDSINTLFQQSTVAILQKENDTWKALLKYLQTKSADTNETIKFFNDITTNKLKLQNIFLTITLILVFVLTFFAIIN